MNSIGCLSNVLKIIDLQWELFAWNEIFHDHWLGGNPMLVLGDPGCRHVSWRGKKGGHYLIRRVKILDSGPRRSSSRTLHCRMRKDGLIYEVQSLRS